MDDPVIRSGDPPRAKARPPRRAVLDLAPLELDCMNTLWPMGEGSVREIRDRLAERLPRAYTTIMTIMDRLARKGIVERRKSGRAYIYRPNLTAEDARAQALGHVVEKFFGGSKDSLIAHLGAAHPAPMARAAAAAASASSTSPASPVFLAAAAPSPTADSAPMGDPPASSIAPEK